MVRLLTAVVFTLIAWTSLSLATEPVGSPSTPYVPGEFDLEKLCTQRHESESRERIAKAFCIYEVIDGSGEPGEDSDGGCPETGVQGLASRRASS